MKKDGKKKGFTLIELIVVIAILGILAAVLIPRFTGFQDKAKSTQALTYAKQIATAIDSYAAEQPTKIDVATANYPIATADKTAIVNLAGLDTVTGVTITLESDGGFFLTANSFSAGRYNGDSSVRMAKSTETTALATK